MHSRDNKTIKMHNGGKIMFTWMLLMEQWWKVQKMVMIALFYIRRYFLFLWAYYSMKYVAIRNLKTDDFVLSSRQSKEIMKKSCKTEFSTFVTKQLGDRTVKTFNKCFEKKVVLKQNKIGTFSLKISHSTMRWN